MSQSWNDIASDIEKSLKGLERSVNNSIHDRFDRNHTGGYIAGVLAGAALGAILTYIFAPSRESKEGAALEEKAKSIVSKIKKSAKTSENQPAS